jgi:phosphatidylinositol glycan class T
LWKSTRRPSADHIASSGLLRHLAYHPSHPPHPSTTSLHFTLTLPAHATLILTIPYSKLTIKYTEHRPDAERGVELPSGVLTLLDLEGEGDSPNSTDIQTRRSSRTHIYTTRLLLDLPTPDFSMPYNVIIMSCTVMAVFFGMMQGALSRRWGYVDTAVEGGASTPLGKLRLVLLSKVERLRGRGKVTEGARRGAEMGPEGERDTEKIS